MAATRTASNLNHFVVPRLVISARARAPPVAPVAHQAIVYGNSIARKQSGDSNEGDHRHSRFSRENPSRGNVNAAVEVILLVLLVRGDHLRSFLICECNGSDRSEAL